MPALEEGKYLHPGISVCDTRVHGEGLLSLTNGPENANPGFIALHLYFRDEGEFYNPTEFTNKDAEYAKIYLSTEEADLQEEGYSEAEAKVIADAMKIIGFKIIAQLPKE